MTGKGDKRFLTRFIYIGVQILVGFLCKVNGKSSCTIATDPSLESLSARDPRGRVSCTIAFLANYATTHSMLMVEMESSVVYPAARKLFLYWLILMESSQSPIEMKRG